ncbi:Abi family protein [Bifidobacterium sp. DSM 109957]|uniref:Abi family protein n=1 Tax=Bifidobacterium oedipodis TaxID=2675322 RepID=A0A7Y0HTJ2_9BIFI|nr:Abi family protein [Bifidobacterium sp. DSM 109957]
MGGGEKSKQAKSVPEMIELLKQCGLTIDVPDMPSIPASNHDGRDCTFSNYDE